MREYPEISDSLKELLRTVDHNRCLRPSFLFTPFSGEGERLGWIEDCAEEGMRWQRLTLDGLRAKIHFEQKERQET